MYILGQLQAKVRCLVLVCRKNGRTSRTLIFFFIFFLCLFGGPQFWWQQISADRAQVLRREVEGQDLLRFHVRAHSNSPRDQKIKNLVAEKVLVHYQPEWSRCKSSAELSLLLKENNTALENVARGILQEHGCTYDVQASLVRDIFPARCYEGKLYPQGEYLALYLILGEGGGENWWCVLFPPLCFSAFPSCTAVDEEREQEESVPINGDAEKNSADRVSPAVGGNNKNGQGRNKVENSTGASEKQPQKWRFWLWEMLVKKRR